MIKRQSIITFLRKFSAWHELTLFILILAIFAIAAGLMPKFLSLKGQLILSRQLWGMALLAIPMTFIIITGGIDLSIGSTMGLSATSFGLTFAATGNIYLASVASTITGTLCGAMNGLFIASFKLHPLIVTLATYALFRGLAEGLSKGESFSGFGDGFSQLARGSIWGIPLVGFFFVTSLALGVIFLTKTIPGRTLYHIGRNRMGVIYSGTNVKKLETLLYAFSGTMAGIVAVIFISRFNTAKADAGFNIELDVITAVVVGGTSIFGGKGNLAGTTLGLILIHETKLFTSRYFQTDELKIIIVGVLLITSVLIQRKAHKS